MKLKYYLKGFGIGIIFATLLLSISFYAGRENKKPISKQEVERLAAAYGMVYPEETTAGENQTNDIEEPETVSEVETAQEQGTIRETETTREQGTTRETETTREQGTTRETETIREIVTVEEQGTNQEVETEEIGDIDRKLEGNEELQTVREDTVVIEKTITVASGMYASSIAELLEDSGVIESAQDFNLYLMRGGYTKRLQAGIYTFVVGMDFDAIAEKLLWESD